MENIIEEILSLAEVALEAHDRRGYGAKVCIDARDYNYRAMVTYRTSYLHEERSILSVAHEERIDVALEVLAEKVGVLAAKVEAAEAVKKSANQV